MKKAKAYILVLLALVGILFSCESKDYETGDGKYSYLLAEMVDVTVKDKVIQKIVTDSDEVLNISSGYTLDVTSPDTTLRWLLYYNKVDAKTPVTLLGNKSVSVLTPRTEKEMRRRYPSFVMKTDTLKVTSVWLSHNRKYLNMNLSLWVGNASSQNSTQSIGMVRDSVSIAGKGRVYYTLYHDQADVPVGYYTQELLASVQTTEQDTIDLRIGNTHYIEVK